MNTSVRDFFKAFLCSKGLWVRYIASWIVMTPFLVLVKPALLDYDQRAIIAYVVYGLMLVGAILWLKKKYPEQAARWQKQYDVQTLSRPELFGLVAFTIVVIGVLGWGLMMAVCFYQFDLDDFSPFPIYSFLASGLAFGALVSIPMLAEAFFPQHKKIITAIFYIVGIGLLILAFSEDDNSVSVMDNAAQTYHDDRQWDEIAVDNADLRQWAEGALPSIQTFNYTTIPLVKDQQRNFFTEAGLKSFNQAMASSRIYETMIAQKQKSKLRIVCPAQIDRSGTLNGAKIWDVIAIVEIDYSIGDQHNSSLLGYSLVIHELGTPEKPYGINQIIAIPVNSNVSTCADLIEQVLNVKRSVSD